MTALRRRWFQFSLRTLFVVVTLLAVPMAWVAYQLRWMRERHAFLADIEGLRVQGVANVILYDDPYLVGLRNESPGEEFEYMKPRHPWSLRALGEPRMAVFVFRDTLPPEWSARAKRLFPEALVGRTY